MRRGFAFRRVNLKPKEPVAKRRCQLSIRVSRFTSPSFAAQKMTYVLEAPVLKPVGLTQVGPSPSLHSGCRWRGMPVLVRERERLACCLRRYRLFHQSFTPP